MAEKTTEEKILDGITALNSRMDGIEATQKDTTSRLDSMETAAKDRAAKDAAEEQAKKDADEKAAKDAADEKAAKDKKDAEDEQAKKDAAAAAAGNDDIKQRLSALEGKVKEPSAEDRAQFVAAQVRADTVFQAFGDAGAPRWLAGESPFAYRKRLVAAHKDKSAAWKGVDLDKITDEVSLANIEATVYKDAMDVAIRPVADSASQTLRAVVTRDATGRQITTFYGHPGACWDAFKHQGKLVTGINTKGDR